MSHPIVFKRTDSAALVTFLQSVALPALVGITLFFCNIVFGVPYDEPYVLLTVIAVVLAALMLKSADNLNSDLPSTRVPLAVGVVLRWLSLVSILLAIGYIAKTSAVFSRRVVLTWIVLTPAVLIIGTLALREVVRRLLLDPSNMRKVVFAGCNDASLSLAGKLSSNAELCMSVTGFFDDRSAGRLNLGQDVKLLGTLSGLAQYVRDNAIDVIFVALPIRHLRRVVDLMDELRDTTASIYYLPDIYVFDLIQARTGDIMGIHVISMCETPFQGAWGFSKRLTDVSISAAVLLLAAPLLALIALAVKLTSPGPVIFRQRRYGLDGQEITVYKFRTMTVTEDGHKVVQATRSDSRVTRIGRFLRRSSLDELPQLINVLQGRMSLVGPRPHAVAHNEEYRKLIKGYMLRHKVLPGITGLAQVNGCRGETARLEEMQARVNYDLDYLRHWSPSLDIKILVMTVIRLFNDKRAY